jgi:nickel-dependent lactate racemase
MIDKWMAQVLARALMDYTLILVSEGIQQELAEQMFFKYAATLDEAFDKALAIAGNNASVCVLPEGPVIIPKVRGA